MSEAYLSDIPVTPPDRVLGAPVGEEDSYSGPNGPFFVIDCEGIGDEDLNTKVFTKDSNLKGLDRAELIPLAKSTKDIAGIVIDLAVALELISTDVDKIESIKDTIRVEQEAVEKIPWSSGSGHYDPEEARGLRQATRSLENIPLLKAAIELRDESPTEHNKRVELVVRRLVRNEVDYLGYDAVQ